MDCENKIKSLASESVKIYQGYLIASRGVSLRVRKSIIKNKSKFYLTFKYTVNNRTIEIEKRIDHRDFNDLWGQSLNRLEKIRYLITSGSLIWEIDFFKNFSHETYFALAEVEMPEGQLAPDVIPNFIKDNLIYEVDLTDNRFSSKLLADVRYATKIYKEITNEKVPRAS